MREQDYIDFIQPYIDAQNNMLTRLEVLNKDFRRKYQNYPIHNIQYRIKEKESIHEKLEKRELPLTAHEARSNLMDISGIRVICYFVEDIYNTVEVIKKQMDLIVIKERDYIREPKENGYRSFHLVLGVPVYHADGMEYFPVEIQLRTMSMDFWASMEHRICYKKNLSDERYLKEEFSSYAEQLEGIESAFDKLNKEHGEVIRAI